MKREHPMNAQKCPFIFVFEKKVLTECQPDSGFWISLFGGHTAVLPGSNKLLLITRTLLILIWFVTILSSFKGEIRRSAVI